MPLSAPPIPTASAADSSLPAARGSAGICNRLRDAIISGDYHCDERLPSERDLAERFAVARGTVRLALKQLEQTGLIKRKYGSGAFVAYNRKFECEDIADETSPMQLIDARLAIEPHIVRVVVGNASNRDLRNLGVALDRVATCGVDPDEFIAADEAFHLSLANCSRNPLLVWMYQRLNDIRAHNQWSARKNSILTPEKIVQYNEQHMELMHLIVSRNIDGAVHSIIGHLQQGKRDLLGRE